MSILERYDLKLLCNKSKIQNGAFSESLILTKNDKKRKGKMFIRNIPPKHKNKNQEILSMVNNKLNKKNIVVDKNDPYEITLNQIIDNLISNISTLVQYKRMKKDKKKNRGYDIRKTHDDIVINDYRKCYFNNKL